jgi:hypothetical protein
MISRRHFAGLAAGAAVGWPLVAQAQPRDGLRRLGVLMGLLASDPDGQARAAAEGIELGPGEQKAIPQLSRCGPVDPGFRRDCDDGKQSTVAARWILAFAE